MRPFRYCLDPLFLVSALLYVMNRACFAPRSGAALFTNHFGDLLLMPCALPVLLWLQRLARLRTHDLPPTAGEIVGTLALWSVLFEVVFPHFGRGVSDPLDVLAYTIGALLAGFAWTWPQRQPALAPFLQKP